MYVHQFIVKGLAHLSYILGGNQTCAVIDPKRDVDEHIEVAKSMGLKITHILETHLHANFISGHLDLVEKTGAKIYAPKAGKCQFDHVPVKEGDTIEIEDMKLNVSDTVGHTPEHVSYVVTDQSRGKEPVAIFCGDTLFVGDVGRPDLFPRQAEKLASRLYDNLHKKLLTLPDFCEVYPAHGAGSLCGPALLEKLPEVRPINPKEFWNLKNNGHIAIDLRDYTAFGGSHVPGSYHFDLAGNFSTFAGWVLPPNKPLILVGNTGEEVHQATIQLYRVGLDQVIGYLEGGISAWTKQALPLEHLPQMSVQ